MTDLRPQTDDGVDGLVRSYLDGEAERIDASAVLDRIRASRPLVRREEVAAVGAADVAARRSSRLWTWAAATAAAVVVAFVGGRHLGSDLANAAVVLRDVQAVHSQGVDRCYRVQYAPDPRHWDGKNKLEGPSQSVLWTRGDRFWSDCAIGDARLAIGREADGTLWVAPSRKKGIRFANDESRLPKEVALLCAINSMSVPKLVDEVLAGFDLRADAEVGEEGRTVIWATLKPGHSHPLLSSALLEIDERNNVVARLVLWMVRDGRSRGTVTFTLLESARRNGDQYELATYLDTDAQIENQTFAPPAAVH